MRPPKANSFECLFGRLTAHEPHTQSKSGRTRTAGNVVAGTGGQQAGQAPMTLLAAGPESVPLAGTLLDYGNDQLDKSVACLPLQCKPSWIHRVMRHDVLKLLDI